MKIVTIQRILLFRAKLEILKFIGVPALTRILPMVEVTTTTNILQKLLKSYK